MSTGPILQQILDETHAQRAVCIRANLERPSLMTVELELCNGLPSMRDDWQSRPANGAYEEILHEVARLRSVQLTTGTMRHGMLRSLYESQGVISAHILSLGHWSIDIHRYLALHYTHARSRRTEKLEILANQLSIRINGWLTLGDE